MAKFNIMIFKVLFLAIISLSAAVTAMAAGGVSIAEIGAVGDGKTLNTAAIQTGIDRLAAKGGGTLVVPEGVFLTGAIFLKPGVNLHLDAGAVIKGSTDRKDYPRRMTRVEGHFEEWLPALINADKIDHLRITGPGTLDGNGAFFLGRFLGAAKSGSKNDKSRCAPAAPGDDPKFAGRAYQRH
jgi:alpha-L-rhamnosidase